MRILITNDDGVSASQLVPLIKWCRKLGEAVVYVPKVEQSAKSHGVEIHKAFEVKKLTLEEGIEVYTVDSTPADCVRFAILGNGEKPDLVISGVNRGLNIGSDIMYSGTVAAACEAANLGFKAIAVSTPPESYDDATEHLDRVFKFVFDNGLLELNGVYNVNIPREAGKILITHQGGPYYSDDFIPQGDDMYLPQGKDIFSDSGDNSLDTDAVMHGYISVMPLTTNRTAMTAYERIKHLSEE